MSPCKAPPISSPEASVFFRQLKWHMSQQGSGWENHFSKTWARPFMGTITFHRFRFYNWVSAFPKTPSRSLQQAVTIQLHILQTHSVLLMQPGIHGSAVQVFHWALHCAAQNLISRTSMGCCCTYICNKYIWVYWRIFVIQNPVSK